MPIKKSGLMWIIVGIAILLIKTQPNVELVGTSLILNFLIKLSGLAFLLFGLFDFFEVYE